MGFEKIYLFGKLEVDLTAEVGSTIVLKTDIPGHAMATRFTWSVTAAARRTVATRLPGSMQGHYVSLTLTPATGGAIRLYGLRVWVRELPNGQWYWFPFPVLETPPAAFQPMPLPIPETAQAYQPMALPIPETPQAYQPMALPIAETNQAYAELRLPIPETPEAYAAAQLPVRPTPPVPEWVSVPIDD